MTTIACNRRLMAADSCVTVDGVGTDRYLGVKLHAIGRSIFGETGDNCNETGLALEWIRAGRKVKSRPKLSEHADFLLLELNPEGIFLWSPRLTSEPIIEENMAVGSGRKVALYCMRVLKMTPAQAVFEASKMDEWTKPPVIELKLKRRK